MPKFPEKCPQETCGYSTFTEPWGNWVKVKCTNPHCSWIGYYHEDGTIVSNEEQNEIKKTWG